MSGAIAEMWRVASTPPMPGMFRSMTTTSGCDLADGAHRLGAGRRLADDLHALLLEQVAQACAEQIVVVDDQHAERLGLPLLGCWHRLAQLDPLLGAAKSSGA